MLRTSQLLSILRGQTKPKRLTKTVKRALVSLSTISMDICNTPDFSNEAGRTFASRLPEKLQKANHDVYFLHRKSGYDITGNGRLSKLKRPKWMSSGVVKDGVVLTTKDGEAPEQPKCTILSDVLEKDVLKKYYISKKALKRILKQ